MLTSQSINSLLYLFFNHSDVQITPHYVSLSPSQVLTLLLLLNIILGYQGVPPGQHMWVKFFNNSKTLYIISCSITFSSSIICSISPY